MILSRASLVSIITSLIRDNAQGLISAANMRTVLRAIVDSDLNLGTDEVTLGLLADDVLAVLGTSGLDATKYQGTWDPTTNTPTIPAAAGGNSGNWYITSAAGTATGNAAGTYGAGDRVRSNGSAWQRMPAPPTIIPDGTITREMLIDELARAFVPSGSQDYVYAIVDINNRVAFGIKPTGELVGNLPTPDGSVTAAKIASEAVTRDKLHPDLEAYLPDDQSNDGGWVYAITDQNGRIAFGIKPDGSLFGKLSPTAGSIQRIHLDPTLEEVLPESLTSDEYVWTVVDQSGRVGLGITPDGSVRGKWIARDNWIDRQHLLTTFADTLPQPSESFDYPFSIVDQDGRIAFAITQEGRVRGKVELEEQSVDSDMIADEAVIPVHLGPELSRRTLPTAGDMVVDSHDNLWRGSAVEIPQPTEASGHGWARFQPLRTPVLYGVNSTGTTIEFRRSPGLCIRGTRYRATWDASTAQPDSNPLPGDWWHVSNAGTLAGVGTFAVGDRLVALGVQFNGGNLGPKWVKQRAGEFFHVGEFTPASFTPAFTVDGDTYVASAGGSYGGFTFVAGDTLARIGGAWRRIPAVDLGTVANGVPFHFKVDNADEIEFRRSDKSTTQVYLTGTGYRTVNPRRHDDRVVMFGDSLVSVVGLDTATGLALAPRPFTAFSYSGASSAQIMTMVRHYIRNGGDAYRGRLHIFFHGQNNSGNINETRRAALEFAAVVGARDSRFIFMSPYGQRVATWNGTRIVLSQFENAETAGNDTYELETWYQRAFPGQFISPRASILARVTSRTTPDLQFPGMTEGQVATTYKALPFSFFFNYSIVPWTPEALTFSGYWSTAGLPTGGTDGQYYVRTGNGFVGYIIVRWAGVWTEHSYDSTHMQRVGNDVLAEAISDFLTLNNL